MVCGSLANGQLERDECLQQQHDQGGNDLDPVVDLVAKDDGLDQLCHSIAEVCQPHSFRALRIHKVTTA